MPTPRITPCQRRPTGSAHRGRPGPGPTASASTTAAPRRRAAAPRSASSGHSRKTMTVATTAMFEGVPRREREPGGVRDRVVDDGAGPSARASLASVADVPADHDRDEGPQGAVAQPLGQPGPQRHERRRRRRPPRLADRLESDQGGARPCVRVRSVARSDRRPCRGGSSGSNFCAHGEPEQEHRHGEQHHRHGAASQPRRSARASAATCRGHQSRDPTRTTRAPGTTSAVMARALPRVSPSIWTSCGRSARTLDRRAGVVVDDLVALAPLGGEPRGDGGPADDALGREDDHVELAVVDLGLGHQHQAAEQLAAVADDDGAGATGELLLVRRP